jgi:tetratricopeptide (TPR) repeat protein
MDLAQRLMDISGALGDQPLQLRATFRLARVHYALGDYRRAVELARRNVEVLQGDRALERPDGITVLSVISRWMLALSLAELGEFTEAVARGSEAILAAETGESSRSGLLHAYQGLGFVYVRRGDFEKGIPLLERALGLCRSGEVPIWLSLIASALGLAYTLTGRVTQVVLPLLEEATSTVEIAMVLPLVGEAYLYAGRMNEAHRFAQRALDVSRSQKRRGSESYALWLHGEIASHREPPDTGTSEGAYRQALALANELGMRPLAAHCHLGLGKLYRRTGDRARADEHLQTALTMYREMGMTFWLERAGAELEDL